MGAKEVALSAATSDALVPLWRPLLSDVVVLLTLHRFSDPARGVVGHSPDELRANLAFLRRHKFRLASLGDLIAEADAGELPRTPTIAFTVDDGYADFKDVAAPIFAEFDCPVTVFLVTEPIDRGSWFWWDRVEYAVTTTRRFGAEVRLGRRTLTWTWSTTAERYAAVASITAALKLVRDDHKEAAIKSLADWVEVSFPERATDRYMPMTWDDVRECGARGVTFAPHTVTHPMLPNVASPAKAQWEILESWKRLQTECQTTVPVFSYPNGAFSQREIGVLAASNLRAAVTTRPHYASRRLLTATTGDTRFAVPRFAYVGERAQFSRVVSGVERLFMRMREGRDGWLPIGSEPPRTAAQRRA